MLRARLLGLLALAASCGRDEPQPPAPAVEPPAPVAEEPPEAASTARLQLVALSPTRDGIVPFPAGSSVRWIDRARTHGANNAERRARILADGERIPIDAAREQLMLEVPAGVALDLLVLANDGQVGEVVPALEPDEVGVVTITLPEREREVSGRLLRPDGSPLGEVSLVVNGRRETWVGADGAFAIALPESVVRLALEVDGWPPLEVVLDAHPERNEPLELRLVAGGTLRARVVAADGTARVGITVEAVDLGSARTDPDGVATLTGLTPGREFRIRLRTSGHPSALLLAPEETLRLDAGQTLEREYVLPARGPVAGRLVDQAGRGVAEVEVGLAQPSAEQPLAATYLDATHLVRRRTVTDAEGAFRFDDVEGARWLVGVAPGAWNARLPRAGRIAPVALPALPGTEDLVLTTARRLELAGRVVDENGAPVVRVRVVARPQAFAGTRDALTRRDGRFTVKGLVPGAHDVWVGDERVHEGLDPASLPLELRIEIESIS